MGKTFLYNNCLRVRVAKSDKLLPEKRDREMDRDRKLTSLYFYKDMNSIGARPQS